MARRSAWITGAVATLISAMWLCVAGSPSIRAGTARRSTANADVIIDNFTFTPKTLTVDIGTTVTWTNHDDIPHTVVSTDGLFKSKARDTDETFAFTFGQAGTYAYYCSIHPKMTGQIVVR
jgi:plastocyanin